MHGPSASSSYPNLSSTRPISSRPTAIQSMSNLSTPPLTSTDALLIADTFRQRMRRPEWPLHGRAPSSLSSSDSSSTIDDGKENGERIRRLASEQILKIELEAEGTLLKKMGGSD
ncbi:hypothetical protein BC941DRAFT_469719 [Chlamydoabsidia padenii]|nr:hypothetical protein BC941DRAFT_469719 [Chlamydoabsidia padenii]